MNKFILDIRSSEPGFEDFKDQLKVYLANMYDIDFSKDEVCGVTIGAMYPESQVKEMAELIFGQSEEMFTDIIRDIEFFGNGPCPNCGAATLKMDGEDVWRFHESGSEAGWYVCGQCNRHFEIE